MNGVDLARREAVRLLLETDGRCLLGAPGSLGSRSLTGVATALHLLSRADRDRHRKLRAHILTGRLRGCPAAIQEQVDDALDWLAAKLPFPLAAPPDVVEDLRDALLYEWSVDGLAPETRAAAHYLLDFADYEEDRLLELEDHDEGGFGGARARRLDPGEPGSSGRFTTIAISSAATAFSENGGELVSSGRCPAPRWRTRERKPALPRIRSAAGAAQALLAQSQHDLAEMKASLRRGRPTEATRKVHDELAMAVARARASRVAAGALADILDCDPATIWRLARKGRELNARFSNAMGEGDRPMPLAA